ncbi:MAG: hypothetical protein ACREAA_05025 [Candidatus Polarisedimenticolia bacterium]
MSRRLGETLISRGKLNEGQLHRALTAQLVFGGHLGSSLLEMGLLDEQALGETLASLYGVPYATHESLALIPYAVIRGLPSRLAQKHKVIPLRLDGRVLQLAMIDPKNILAVDEISFVTGYRIVPWVSPEVRILEALEKYYDVARAPRFVTLARELATLPSSSHRLKPQTTEDMIREKEAIPTRAEAYVPAGQGGSAPAAEAARVGSGETNSDPWEAYGYGRSWQEVAEGIDEQPRQESRHAEEGEEDDTRPQPRATLVPGEAISMMTVSRRLAEAGSVDEVIGATLAYASARLPRTILFVIRGGLAVAWSGHGWSVSDTSWRQLVIPVASKAPTLLTTCPEKATHYLGPVAAESWAAGFYGFLNAELPRTALLMPIRIRGRAAAYLYGDGAAQNILAIDLPSMSTLCARAAFALQIMILRNKILAS